MNQAQQIDAEPFGDESADAAVDLLRLFTRAKTLVGESRAIRRSSDLDSHRMLVEMRSRLADAIVDDCLLFDERTIISMFEFLAAWRRAAFESDLERQSSADADLESIFGRAADGLGKHLLRPSGGI